VIYELYVGPLRFLVTRFLASTLGLTPWPCFPAKGWGGQTLSALVRRAPGLSCTSWAQGGAPALAPALARLNKKTKRRRRSSRRLRCNTRGRRAGKSRRFPGCRALVSPPVASERSLHLSGPLGVAAPQTPRRPILRPFRGNSEF
jgi:hypothetical protein